MLATPEQVEQRRAAMTEILHTYLAQAEHYGHELAFSALRKAVDEVQRATVHSTVNRLPTIEIRLTDD